MKYAIHLLLLSCLLISACTGSQYSTVSDANDYQTYFRASNVRSLNHLQTELSFWEKKWKQDTGQFPFLVQMANAHTALFKQSGKVEHLTEAGICLERAVRASNGTITAYLRALAHNYISQHRFKEALELLKSAESQGDKLNATQKMLFDVYLELGNKEEAAIYLSKFTQENSFDYLIRLSKWSDHEGDLDKAIFYMEKAKAKAEAASDKGLMQWSYTNLADYYGHAGRIEEAYNHYLMALAIDPDDAYAKKGIIWIVFSHERNAEQALALLNTLMQHYSTPDHYLLKAEIAAYMGDEELRSKSLGKYWSLLENPHYGDMYNAYSIELLAAADKQSAAKAIMLSEKEVRQRATPQTYDLLAWSYFKSGQLALASDLMKMYVVDKTSEPLAMLHMAHIYKASGEENLVASIKSSLQESTFELGPLTAEEVESL